MTKISLDGGLEENKKSEVLENKGRGGTVDWVIKEVYSGEKTWN